MRSRGRWVCVVGAVAVAVLVVVGVAIFGRSAGAGADVAPRSDPLSPTAPRPSSEASSGVKRPSSHPTDGSRLSASPRSKLAAPTPTPSVPTATAKGKPTVVPTQAVRTMDARLDRTGNLGNGVAVKVTKIESVSGVAQGPGEIAGPSLRVTVSVSNRSSRPISMGLALLNLYYGPEKTPASELSGPAAAPLSGKIAPRSSESGKYVFNVPRNDRDRIFVEFSYTTHAPTVVFKGAA